jgi:hypothetical protein
VAYAGRKYSKLGGELYNFPTQLLSTFIPEGLEKSFPVDTEICSFSAIYSGKQLQDLFSARFCALQSADEARW